MCAYCRWRESRDLAAGIATAIGLTTLLLIASAFIQSWGG